MIASVSDGTVISLSHVRQLCLLADATRRSMDAHNTCVRVTPPAWDAEACPEDSPC